MNAIDGYAYLEEDGSLAILRSGQWRLWATGPYVDSEARELRVAGVPYLGSITYSELAGG